MMIRLPPKSAAWRSVVPSVLLSIVLAVVAQVISKQFVVSASGRAVPAISPVLIGMVLGLTWRQFVGLAPDSDRGVRWVVENVLRAGIALVGLRLTLHGLAIVSVVAVPVVVSCVAVALLMTRLVGRALGVSSSLRQLIAVGTAVCGCTAIIATAPSVRARTDETATALTCVVLLGSVGMMLYPWLAEAVFAGSALPIGVFLGSAIHDTSQVVGAALIYSQQLGSSDVVGIASATKLLRNLSIVALVPLMAWSAARARTEVGGGTMAAIDRARVAPAFVIWFIAFVAVRAVGDHVLADHSAEHLWRRALSVSQGLSELLLICGMTAVGLSIAVADVFRIGPRAMVTALIVALATASCSLGLTCALVRMLP